MNREMILLAGEASGDDRGAELIRALRSMDSSLFFSGMGGPKMRAEGMENLSDLSDLAVVGIIEVLKHYGTFKRAMKSLLSEINRREPCAVIGVDYPGFNLRLMRKIHQPNPKRSIQRIQYISPQLWAWNESRKWQMAEYLDMVLCIFPFEPKVYEETGLKAVFVGHPFGSMDIHPEASRNPYLIAFFPGSREREIHAHMPIFTRVETQFRASHPELQFHYAASSDQVARAIRSHVADAHIENPSILRALAKVGVVCSGTATLEAALAGLPMCAVYRVAWPTYWMGRMLIKVPFLAMPNLLAQQPIVKEFIQSGMTADNITSEILRLLHSPGARENVLKGYQEVRARLGNENAPQNAAREILALV